MKRLICALLLAALLCPALVWAQGAGILDQYPGYVFVDEVNLGDLACVLAHRADGRLVVIGGVKDGDAYATHESAPLPEGMNAGLEYAMENKSFTLILRDENGARIAGYSLAPYGETWGILMGDDTVGNFWVILDRSPNAAWMFGSHPWSDMSAIDWTKMPASKWDVLKAMDTQGWATPYSPNYHDRVHLRAAPRQDAVSLGKYYNGTPIRVLERGETWTHVSIFGVEGYMMTDYLAFGGNVALADNGLYRQVLSGENAELYEWPDEDAEHTTISPQRGVMILAVVGDDWYHIWDIRSGESGYLHVEDIQAGNG